MKVFSSNELVAHAWANEKQPCGYTSSRNFSFDGRELKSYSTTIGYVSRFDDGQRFYVWGNRSYSVTTQGKHKTAMHSAASHLYGVKVDEAPTHHQMRSPEGFIRWVGEQVDYLKQELDAYPGKIKRARASKQWQVESYDRERANANRFLKLVNQTDGHREALDNGQTERLLSHIDRLRESIPSNDTIDTLTLEAGAYVSQQKEKTVKTEAEQVEEWKRGKRQKLNVYHTTYLRINKNHDVETSKGMTIPNREARIAFEAFKRGKLLGMRLLGYTVTQVDSENRRVVAGCHSVPFDDIEALGPQLVLLMSA